MEKFMDIHDNSCSKPSAKRYNFIFMFILVLFDKLQFIKTETRVTYSPSPVGEGGRGSIEFIGVIQKKRISMLSSNEMRLIILCV